MRHRRHLSLAGSSSPTTPTFMLCNEDGDAVVLELDLNADTDRQLYVQHQTLAALAELVEIGEKALAMMEAGDE